MTGTRFGLRRWSGCNLHVYSPLPSYSPQFSRTSRERTRLERLARTRLHISREQASDADGIDRYGPWVWMSGSDCLWDWLANRPFMYTPLYEPLYRLHEHVHTPHDHPKRSYVFQPLKCELTARIAALSCFLDERWDTNVWRGRLAFQISVKFDTLDEHQRRRLAVQLPDGYEFTEQHAFSGPRTRVTWTERASNQHFAREQSEARVERAELGIGSSWATPRQGLAS